MAQGKRYLGESGLQKLIEMIKAGYAKLVHSHTISDITDYTVDSEILSDSKNPVQNKVIKAALDGKVPKTRTVNGKSLNADILLNASDVGAATPTQVNIVQTNLDKHIGNESVHFTETERTKLSGIAEGAQKNTVTGVKGSSESTYRTGNINITKANIGLSNVNNTSDANKPVSTAQQAALDGHNTNASAHNDIRLLIEDINTKLMNFLDLGTDESTGKEVIDSVSELVGLYEENADLINSITTSKVNVSDIIDNLTTASTSKVLSANQGVEIKKLIDALQTTVNGKANSGHTHDDRYYTESEINTKLSGKANTSHGNHVPTTETANNAKFLRNDNTWQTVKPENIGAAKSSHGTHVSYSTTAPVMDGTASVGSAGTVARSDHKHPTDTSRASKTEFDTHTSDTTKHITSTERTNWNSAKTHADSAHAPSDAQKNQNAFSNIKVGSTTISADNATDTLELVGSNVTITPDATNDKVTIAVASGSTSAKGIVQLTNSTSSTSTTTAATPNSVKSAYDLANTAKTNAATAQSKADSAYTLAESKVDSLSDLGITATATELNYMDGVTSNVQTQLDGKAPSSHTNNKSNPHGVTLSQLGVNASSTELNRVKGVTSDVQTQLNAKAIIKTLTSEDLNSVVKEGFYNAGGGNTTTNKPSGIDHFGMIVTHNASGTYHTQILMGSDGKQWRRTCTNGTWGNWNVDKLTDTTYSAAGSSLGLVKSGGDVTISSGVITVNDDSHNHTIANVDNLQGTLDGKQATITGGASTITGSNLTANRALISNGSGKVAVSVVTSTELGYLDGVTSNIQTQLDGKSGTGHTHNYAGSSSVGGSANSAVKLVTARTIGLNGDMTGSVSFDGSANATITAKRRRCTVGQNSNTTTNPYYKFASIKLTSAHTDTEIVFKVSTGYSLNTASGILRAHFRTNSDIKKETAEIYWEYANSGIDNSKFIMAYSNDASPTIELWVKIDASYLHYQFDVLQEHNRTGHTNSWTLYNTSSAGSASAITSGYTQLASSFLTIKNAISGNAGTATKLTTSAGSATKPIYFSDGKPVACTYELKKTVPSDAVFTDTKYTLPVATSSALGGVKSGTDITVDSSGNVSVNDNSHNHNASNINAGTLSSDRLPTVPIAKGGTGATTAAGARANLGVLGASDIVDNLESESSTLPLSANQGRVINEKLMALDGTPFRFGVNENGEYGYIVTDSEGADAVIPFNSGEAIGISYDNTISNLTATNVQDAIDEQNIRLLSLEGGFSNGGLLDVQSGSWTSDTLSYNNQQQHLVVFEKQFKSIPTVKIAIKTKLATGNYNVTVSSITEASFLITFKVTTNATFAMELDWVAEAPAVVSEITE